MLASSIYVKYSDLKLRLSFTEWSINHIFLRALFEADKLLSADFDRPPCAISGSWFDAQQRTFSANGLTVRYRPCSDGEIGCGGPAAAAVRVQMSVCSDITRASSASMPR